MENKQIAQGALVVLAVGQLITYGVLSGQPNIGMMAVAAVPLVAAALLQTRRRWVAVTAVLVAVASVIGSGIGALSFDLVRPGSVGPFAVAVVQLLAAGVAIAFLRPFSVRAGLAAGVVVSAVAGLGIALALGQTDDTGRLTADQLAKVPTVTMVNYRFEPAQLKVQSGQPVAFRFVNTSGDDHDFVIDQLGVNVSVPSGRTRVAVVDVPAGTYALHCSMSDHRESGMVGRLTVDGQHHHG
ncbi:cupredoxin domain-containing protein [Kibdelosporangium aridum]|nr:cupredoxin domain-containing protein [Kibdelosporangium aridum]